MEACGELRLEYVKVCAMTSQRKLDDKESEFCQAFENICFRIPKDEPDQATVPSQDLSYYSFYIVSISFSTVMDSHIRRHFRPENKKKKRINFTKFCEEFMNRYLFAVVFCPIYSERCHVPLPNRPVVPTRKPPLGRRSRAIERLCRSYRGFAETYCSNPFALSQSRYREGCERYWRFCVRRNG
uniref:BPTI/Kunitz inhibitor domain-containing protein n=1 Tax=Angiostrongylus cantonensis TaxID=6313 RepID=A0A0K0D1A5_ANGCA